MPSGTRFYRWTDTELVLCEKRLTSNNPDGFYFVATVGNLKTGGPQGWGGLQFDATGRADGRPVRYFLPVVEAARTPAPAASEPAAAEA